VRSEQRGGGARESRRRRRRRRRRRGSRSRSRGGISRVGDKGRDGRRMDVSWQEDGLELETRKVRRRRRSSRRI
jgi:hypothetical protein